MKILFVQDLGVNESLAICALSAALRARGHETRLLLDRNERDLIGRAAEFGPHLFITPANILNSVWAVAMSRRLKSAFPQTPILHAGTLATFFPENLAGRTPADAIAVGEAEIPTLAYVAALASGRSAAGASNLFVREGGEWKSGPMDAPMTDMENMPLPDRGLYYHYSFMRRMPFKRFSSGRGCMYSCAYCFNAKMRDIYRTTPREFIRKRRPDSVIEEIRLVRRISPLTTLHFSDDVFPASPEWVTDFADRYSRDVALPYSVNATAEQLSEKLVEELRRSGCRAIFIGVEVGNEERRVRSLKKNITNEQIVEGARRVHDAGMKLITFNMMALRGETAADVRDTILFNHRLGADHALVGFAFPVPGTQMYEDAAKEREGLGTVLEEEIERAYWIRRRPMFGGPDDERLERLYPFFPAAVRWPRLLSWAWRRSLRPLSPWLKTALGLLAFYAMKRAFAIPILPGLAYLLRAGDIEKRTTVYAPLL